MIECPACRISFSPRFRHCPRCRAYEARLDDRLEFLARAAEMEIDRGATDAEAADMVVGEGLSPLEAGEMVAAASKKVARAERRYGLIRVFGGAGLLFLAAVVTAVGMCAGPSPWGFRLLLAGVFLGLAAAWPFALGIYSVLTGREKQ